MADTPRTLPLRLTQDGTRPPVLTLAGIDITRFVAAEGLSIDYTDYGVRDYSGRSRIAVPVVTIKFGLGKINLDFDVELLERLLADAKAAG